MFLKRRVRHKDGKDHVYYSVCESLRIHSGRGVVLIEGESRALEPGTCVMVSPNAEHEVVQIGTQPLKLSSVYAPPVHVYNRVEHVRPAEEDTDKA